MSTMTGQAEERQLSPLRMRLNEGRSKLSAGWSDLPLLVKIVLLIIASPIIVFSVSWLVQHTYFRDLYAKPTTIAYAVNVGPACTVLASSGIWVQMKCGEMTTVAPLAGIRWPSDDKEAGITETVLDQLWAVKNGTRLVADLSCQLVTVTEAGIGKEATPKMQFARCSIGKLSLAGTLFSLGAAGAPVGSPASRALDLSDVILEEHRAAVALSDRPSPLQDARRATALAIQAWVATILGFVVAAFGVIEGIQGRVETDRQRRARLRAEAGEHLDRFLDCNRRLKRPLGREKVVRQRERTKEALSALQAHVREQAQYDYSWRTADITEALSNIGDVLDDDLVPSDTDVSTVVDSLRRFTKA